MVASVAVPSRVHVTGKAATLLQEGLLRMYGYQDLHDSILVIPHAHMSWWWWWWWCGLWMWVAPLALLCFAGPCGEDSVMGWMLVWHSVGTAS